MNALYARIHPKRGLAKFFRCGIWFTSAWQKLADVDAATAKRLRAEQMLEVSTTEPEGFALEQEDESPTKSNSGDNSPADPELGQRLLAIRDAISKMDREDEALWTSGGKPKTEAISAMLGWNVSAVERDAAMAQSEEQQ